MNKWTRISIEYLCDKVMTLLDNDHIDIMQANIMYHAILEISGWTHEEIMEGAIDPSLN